MYKFARKETGLKEILSLQCVPIERSEKGMVF